MTGRSRHRTKYGVELPHRQRAGNIMGTRAITIVSSGGKEILNLYRQFDGYQDCHGSELKKFSLSKKSVNGLSGSKDGVFNGAGCFCAQLVAHFKKEAGNFYIYPIDSRNCGQDYEYHISFPYYDAPSDPIKLKVISHGRTLFDGLMVDYDPEASEEE